MQQLPVCKTFSGFLCFPACCFLDRQTVGVSAAGDFPGSRCYTPPCRRWEEAFHRCCELVFHLRSSQIISLCSLLSQLHSSVSETMVPPKKVPEILSSRNHLKMTTVSSCCRWWAAWTLTPAGTVPRCGSRDPDRK